MSETKKSSGLPLPEAMAGNFQDAARWFNQLWAASTDPTARVAGALPSMMMPTMDVKELEKRIADLRSVEHWLELNLGLLRTTIQGLDMQRATLQAWQDFGAAAGAAPGAKPAAGAAGNPFQLPPGLAGADNPAFQPAVWWNALQQQFAQMAASAVAQDPTPAAGSAAKGATGEAAPAAGAKPAGSKPKT